MEVVVVAHWQTYSLANKSNVDRWIELPMSIDAIHPIHDFDIRAVDAGLAGKSLYTAFPELSLSYDAIDVVTDAVAKKFNIAKNEIEFFKRMWPVTVALYIEQYHIAMHVDLSNRFRLSMNREIVFNASCIDDVKKEMCGNEQ